MGKELNFMNNCMAEMTDTYDDCLAKSKDSNVDDVKRCKRRASAAFEACQMIQKWRAMDGLDFPDIVFVLDRFIRKIRPGITKPDFPPK